VNVVLHRDTIDRVPQLIELAESLEAERLELANVQFYGWADANRDSLPANRDALLKAGEQVKDARKRLNGKLEIVYVLPDGLSERPKTCMGGWGVRQLTVNPFGDVLPCPNAGCISSLRFENVRDHSLRSIWNNSESFNCFRGTEWMLEPCKSCAFREVDRGGCRCQAHLLTGDASNADPACSLSPAHSVFQKMIAPSGSARPAWRYRNYPSLAVRPQN
jgi:pyrroloquinoline quinone biosynthesis protein E